MPSKYIYEPWLAPKEVQKNVGCVIGKDYPAPIVDHAVISKVNIQRMKASYAKNVSAKDKAKVENPFADNSVTVKKSVKKTVKKLEKKEDGVKKEAKTLSASKKRKTPSSKISPKKQPKIDATLKKLKIKEEKK
jgi:cryptochrome